MNISCFSKAEATEKGWGNFCQNRNTYIKEMMAAETEVTQTSQNDCHFLTAESSA